MKANYTERTNASQQNRLLGLKIEEKYCPENV
jgi:hypothetical protein